MFNLKKFIVVTLFLLAVGLSCRSVILSQKNHTAPVFTSIDRPDAFSEHVIATVFNKQGNIAFQLQSPQMIHYHQEDTTQIQSPQITIHRQAAEKWHIQSNHAIATHGIDKILFQDHVIIFHENNQLSPITTVKTTELTIFPNEELAKTDKAVSFIQPNTEIIGTGMLANMKLGSVKLLSQTRSEYVPQS